MVDKDNNTITFSPLSDKGSIVKNTMHSVKIALEEKGYNPVNQIVGYIMSGDPTYITSYNDARSLITKIDRDELLEEIVNYYLIEKE